MGVQLDVTMVGTAPSLSRGIDAVLDRLDMIGFQLEGTLYDYLGPEERDVRCEGTWAATVDAWDGASFNVFRDGPGMVVALEKVEGTTVRAFASMSMGSLQRLFADQGKHAPAFYAPVLQIALALGARAGVGNIEVSGFKPWGDTEVERAIGSSPVGPPGPSLLGFLRRDPGAATPGEPFVVTPRPEGYWLLEHPDLLDFLKVPCP